jgi:hypothetical protein
MNLNNENNMIVYVVMGGHNYEGETAESSQVFRTRDDAVAYGESLEYYDYYEIVEREIK